MLQNFVTAHALGEDGTSWQGGTGELPDGWLESEPLKVPDATKSKPSTWDEEEDGAWEAPLVDNPACSVGCGPYDPSPEKYVPRVYFFSPDGKHLDIRPKEVDKENPHFFASWETLQTAMKEALKSSGRTEL